MMELFNMKGRSAVVTGGSRGIGLAISSALLRCGAEVHVFDVSPGGEEGERCHFHQVNIADPEDVKQTVARLPDGVSLLVNNAGITRDRSLLKMNDDEWQSVLSVNLTGAFNVSRALAP